MREKFKQANSKIVEGKNSPPTKNDLFEYSYDPLLQYSLHLLAAIFRVRVRVLFSFLSSSCVIKY